MQNYAGQVHLYCTYPELMLEKGERERTRERESERVRENERERVLDVGSCV